MYISTCLLEMVADKSAIQKLMKDRELITENAIETVSSKLPGKVVNIDINELKPYLDNDALLCLESTSKSSFL